MFNWLKRKNRYIAPTRCLRVKRYLKNLAESYQIGSDMDKKVLNEINIKINEKTKKIKRINIVKAVCYVGIYLSFISLFFNLFQIPEISRFLSGIIGSAGTTLFLIGLYFANRITILYYQDLNLLASHAISIYSKNNFITEKLFEEF